MKFKKYFENEIDIFFDKEKILNNIKKRGKEVSRRKIIEPLTIICYRGFDANFSKLEYTNDGKIILSPKKSEQQMLWFTHIFIRGYNPKEYVKGRGNWLLTYPLKAKKHYDLISYEDGSTEQKKPENLNDEPTENSRYLCFWDYCIELPEGWFFSYKMEKFIATTKKIIVSKNMISKNV